MTKEKVVKLLHLFFQIHDMEGKDNMHLEKSEYDDKFFRWTKESFKNDRELTCIFNDHRICIFSTVKMKERLLANMDKVQHDKERLNFGCQYSLVKDLIYDVYAEEISEEEVIEFNEGIAKANLDKETAEKYAEFSVRCDRSGLPLLKVEDFLKQLNDEE